MLSVLFAGVMSGFSLGQAMPNIRHVHEAIRAGLRLVAILEEPGTMTVQNEGLILDVCFIFNALILPSNPNNY